ncbi:MAG TPA: DinB family protein [Puia sp.]|nr:DinB family protein [Puia sp.]
MALFSRTSLITELLDRTELLKANTQVFFRLTDEQLRRRPAPGKWSIAEIYGHLNLSMDASIRTILSRITRAPDRPGDEYTSSLLGDWAYSLIMPRPDGSVFRLKAIKMHCPDPAKLDGREELDVFQRHCDALDDILRHVASKDLRGIRIPFFAPRIIRLRLGDVLRYLVAHGERHLLQAHRAANLVG